MDLPQFLNQRRAGAEEPPRAPRVLLYIPPHGRAVHCPSIEAATAAAQTFAAEHPGRTVGVYELIGYAHLPLQTPEFTPANSEKAAGELLESPPDTLNSDQPAEGAR